MSRQPFGDIKSKRWYVSRPSASSPRFERFFAQAYLASNIAKNFRRRYDDLKFIESLEKPFEWTDPAEVHSFTCHDFPSLSLT